MEYDNRMHTVLPGVSEQTSKHKTQQDCFSGSDCNETQSLIKSKEEPDFTSPLPAHENIVECNSTLVKIQN